MFILLLYMIIASSMPLFAMQKEESRKISKSGWQMAQAGNFGLAEQALVQAAKQGSLKAALFLVKSYTSGSAITVPDLEKARIFADILDQLKEQRKAFHLKKEQEQTYWKRTPEENVSEGQRSFDREMQRLEQKVKTKNDLIQANNYVREYPWFKEVVDFLASQPHSPFISYRTNRFKTPTIERAGQELVSLASNKKKPSDQALLLLKKMAEFVKSPKVFQAILEVLNNDWNGPSFEVRKELLRIAHPWACEHNPAALKKAYSSYIFNLNDSYEFGGNKTEEVRTELFNEITESLRIYGTFDAAGACHIADQFIQHLIKHMHPGFLRSSRPLCMLATLRSINTLCFEKYAREIISTDKIVAALEILLIHSEVAVLFEGSCMSLEALIETVLKSAQEEKPKIDAFTKLIARGAAYHKKYESEIIRTLPIFYKNKSECNNAKPLFKSPLTALREAAFQLYLNNITTSASRDTFWEHNLVDRLLEEDLVTLTAGDLSVNCEERLYQDALQKNNDYAIQKLFCKVAADKNPQSRAWQARILREYVEASDENSETTDDLKPVVTSALERGARGTSSVLTLARIRQIVETASATGFLQYIDAQFLKEFTKIAALSDITPLAQRAQFFNDLVMQQLNGKGLTADALEDELASLRALLLVINHSPFTKWANTVLDALSLKQNYLGHFRARRELIDLHKEFSDLPACPDVITRIHPRLYHALRERYQPEQPLVHETVDSSFKELLFAPGNLMFGYVPNDTGHYRGNENYYRLYACDKTTGLPLWASPVQVKETYPFGFCGTFKEFSKRGWLENGDPSGYFLLLPREILLHVYEILTVEELWALTNVDEQKDEAGETIFVSTFVVYDAKNGVIKCDYVIRTKEKIKDVIYCKPFGRYIITDEGLHVWRDHSQNLTVSINLLKDVNTNFVECIGQRLLFPSCGNEEQAEIAVYNLNGEHYRIPTGASHFFKPTLFGSQNLLFMAPYSEKRDFQRLACFKAENGQPLWEYQLPSNVKKAILSADESILYILTEKQLIALSTAVEINGMNRLLWETSIVAPESIIRDQITDIQLSEDERTLYGLHDYNKGHLYRFDTKSGEKTYLYAVNEARGHKFVGFHNNKPYLCSYSF